MSTIREVIEERINKIKSLTPKDEMERNIYIASSGDYEIMLKEILPIEEAYKKRIEELEKEVEYWKTGYSVLSVDLANLQEKAKAYDLLMEMPEGIALLKTNIGFFVHINSKITANGGTVVRGQTPQEALLKLKDKLTSDNK